MDSTKFHKVPVNSSGTLQSLLLDQNSTGFHWKTWGRVNYWWVGTLGVVEGWKPGFHDLWTIPVPSKKAYWHGMAQKSGQARVLERWTLGHKIKITPWVGEDFWKSDPRVEILKRVSNCVDRYIQLPIMKWVFRGFNYLHTASCTW